MLNYSLVTPWVFKKEGIEQFHKFHRHPKLHGDVINDGSQFVLSLLVRLGRSESCQRLWLEFGADGSSQAEVGPWYLMTNLSFESLPLSV